MLRPENLHCLTTGIDADNVITAELASRTYQGPSALLECITSNGHTLYTLEANSAASRSQDIGATVKLGWSSSDQRILPAELTQ